MLKKTVIVEINLFEQMFPLVSAYLEAYARQNDTLTASYEFDHLAVHDSTDSAQICSALIEKDADIYAFSCYVWNMGLIRKVLEGLKARKPNATYILGGPQVMNQAEKYIGSDEDNVIVCNGEGEKTYSNILLALLSDTPDLSTVNGISFRQNGEMKTTAPEQRIQNLDEIPSPYALESMKGQYYMSVIETNRGCPFRCGFCFWGAANNDRVFKFSEDRVYADLEWLGKSRIPVFYIADANWGMLKRDVEFSRYMAECNTKYKTPISIAFNASKNSPDRVTEITQIFNENKLVSSQPISIQSLNDHTLELVDRKNIKLSAYSTLQDDLNDRGIGSFVELIWPLPGETLSTLKSGLAELSRKSAGTITVYAHLLLQNTPIWENRETHGIVTRLVEDENGEAEVVIATSEVSEEEFIAGVWHIYGTNALHNAQTANSLMKYLDAQGTVTIDVFVDQFMAFAEGFPDHPFTKFCQYSINNMRYYDFVNFPTIFFVAMHESRAEFTQLLRDFAQSQEWWADRNARFMFEFDVVRKPYIYKDTPEEYSATDFEFITITQKDETGRKLDVYFDAEFLELARNAAPIGLSEAGVQGMVALSVDHDKMPYNLIPTLNEKEKADRLNSLMTRSNTIMPTYELLGVTPHKTSALNRLFKRLSMSA